MPDVISPQGPPPPACIPPRCGPSPRLARHDLSACSCCGVIRPPICCCAAWWSWRISCCFCCGVRDESLHTDSTWLCVLSSICLRCCIADCEMPACCQQGEGWAGRVVVVPRGEAEDGAVCATSGYVESKVITITAKPNRLILVMETSAFANPNPSKRLLGKDTGPVAREASHLRSAKHWYHRNRLCYILHRYSHSPHTMIPEGSLPAAA